MCRKVWDALTGDVLHSFEHKHIVRACAFSEFGSPPHPLSSQLFLFEMVTFIKLSSSGLGYFGGQVKGFQSSLELVCETYMIFVMMKKTIFTYKVLTVHVLTL